MIHFVIDNVDDIISTKRKDISKSTSLRLNENNHQTNVRKRKLFRSIY